MKTKPNTHAITREEYDQFFSDDITVRRKKELAKKINQRARYLSDVFDCTEGLEYGVEYIFSEYNHKQRPGETLTFSEDGDSCYYYLEFEELPDVNPIQVRLLWDDEKLNVILKQIEAMHEKERKQEEKENLERSTAKSFILSQFSKDQIDIIKNNLHIFSQL